MKILQKFLKAQWIIIPWVIIAVFFFSILYSNFKVGIVYGIATLFALNLTYLIYVLFIEDKESDD